MRTTVLGICGAFLFIGCAPREPDPGQIAVGLEKIARAVVLRPTTDPFGEPSPELEAEVWQIPPNPPDLRFIIEGEGFRLIHLRHHGVYLETVDGTIIVLVPDLMALKEEGASSGMIYVAAAAQSNTKASREMEEDSANFIIDVGLQERAMHALVPRLAWEMRHADSSARFQSLRWVAQRLLKGHCQLAPWAPVLHESPFVFEVTPEDRSALVRAILLGRGGNARPANFRGF